MRFALTRRSLERKPILTGEKAALSPRSGFLSVLSAGIKGESQVALVEDSSASQIGRVGSAASEVETALRAGLAAIAVLILLRFVLAATANLAEDEAYYWLWSTHLASGYYDHPPMIAYWIRAGTAIFGQTEFGVRFLGLMSAIGGSYLLYETSLSLFRDRSAAWLCVFWMNATLLCNAGAIVATPDTPLGFFTTAALFALAKLIETQRGAWWYAIGASLGLAFMSKYTAALLLPGLFLWMIASAEGRRWFLRPEPYIGAVIAILIIAPVVSWNYAHDWASFAKQTEHSIKDKPANAFLSVLEFFGGQAGLATPLIFLFCLFGSGYALIRGFQRGEARWLLLGAMTAPMLASSSFTRRTRRFSRTGPVWFIRPPFSPPFMPFALYLPRKALRAG